MPNEKFNPQLKPIVSSMKQALSDIQFFEEAENITATLKSTSRVSAIDLIARQPWAIQSEMLETIISIARGDNESPEAVAAKLGRPLQNTRTVSMRGDVAIVPVTGPIFRYANLFTEISGATSLSQLSNDFNAALDDPAVSSIVLEIDSPGGQAAGIAEFAHMVRNSDKPVTAYVDGMGASAAYWIAAAADDLVINKTAMVGSIGAIFGVSKNAESDVVEFVSTQSPMKRPDPESDEGRTELQQFIDALAQVFIEDVAIYRDVSVETVLSDFGKGGVRLGEEAVKLGMADRVSTLEEVIAGMAGSTKGDFHKMGTKDKATPAAETPVIDRAYLDENCSELVSAIRQEGYDEGKTAGATAECERIKSVEEQTIAGHEALITELKFDGKTTGAEAAVKVLAAEKQSRTDTFAAHKKDAPKPVDEPAVVDDDTGKSELSFEDKCQAKWDKDSDLRTEFNNDYEAFTAFEKANAKGNVRVLGQ